MTHRTRFQQKLELARISPADIALTRTAAEWAQTREQRMRETMRLLKIKAAKRA